MIGFLIDSNAKKGADSNQSKWLVDKQEIVYYIPAFNSVTFPIWNASLPMRLYGRCKCVNVNNFHNY